MSHNHNHVPDGGAKNIKIALIMNLVFTIIELVGGLLTNSLAIISDAIHDFGDTVVLIVSYLSTKVAKKKPTAKHTFGFKRASLFAALLAGLVLLAGSVFIVVNAIPRLFEPQEVHSIGIVGLAIVGVIANGFAALKTSKGKSQNEKIVSWHMLEDVLNWAVVLVGGIIMHFTGWYIIDPILSIGFAIFIIFGSTKNLLGTLSIFMESAPSHIDIDEVEKSITSVKGVCGTHDIHIWSLDGETSLLTAHVVINNNVKNISQIKREIRDNLADHHITHTTLELEYSNESNHKCPLDNAPKRKRNL